jgi:type II secretory pathway pseudopilin PulG
MRAAATSRRRRRRPRGDAGFTLFELLVAMPIGLTVLTAAFTLLTHSWQLSTTVSARQEALQRGRTSMELITRQLRSTVCLSVVTPARAIISGNSSSVTFFADLGDGTTPPQTRTLTLDPATATIMQAETDGAGSPPTFGPVPTRTRRLMEGAVAAPGIPFLRYYAYVGGVLSTTPLPTPLSVADAARTTDVAVTFTAAQLVGGVSGSQQLGTTFTNDVFSRTVDPMNAKAGQACV